MMNTELEWPYRVGCLVCSAEIDATSSNAVCDSCRSDAALGRAVRRFREGMALFKQNPEWAFRQGYSGDIIRCDTPEAALQAAGLMEGEEK